MPSVSSMALMWPMVAASFMASKGSSNSSMPKRVRVKPPSSSSTKPSTNLAAQPVTTLPYSPAASASHASASGEGLSPMYSTSRQIAAGWQSSDWLRNSMAWATTSRPHWS